MEKGIGYYDAVVAAGYDSDSRSAEASEKLPYYGEVLERDVVDANSEKDPRRDGEAARYGRIPNPTVHIGLNQLRRMVNQLIEAYGKPEEIVVELARDLKMNRKQKQNYERQQREGGQRNEHLMECLQSAEIPVTSDVLRKLRLWEEQGPPQARRCPYTGDVISFSMAVSAATEIDHILPFSKTLDDSPANKVVCIARANRDKGDRSPYEAFGHSPAGYDYQAILDRADELPGNKRELFQPDAMQKFEDEDHFLDRQLNETRYLSRTARTYLAHLYDEKTEGRQHVRHVRVIPGRMTALLRRGWGLEGHIAGLRDRRQAARRSPPPRYRRLRRRQHHPGPAPTFRPRIRLPLRSGGQAEDDSRAGSTLGRLQKRPATVPGPHDRVLQARPQHVRQKWQRHHRAAPQ